MATWPLPPWSSTPFPRFSPRPQVCGLRAIFRSVFSRLGNKFHRDFLFQREKIRVRGDHRSISPPPQAGCETSGVGKRSLRPEFRGHFCRFVICVLDFNRQVRNFRNNSLSHIFSAVAPGRMVHLAPVHRAHQPAVVFRHRLHEKIFTSAVPAPSVKKIISAPEFST